MGSMRVFCILTRKRHAITQSLFPMCLTWIKANAGFDVIFIITTFGEDKWRSI